VLVVVVFTAAAVLIIGTITIIDDASFAFAFFISICPCNRQRFVLVRTATVDTTDFLL
jgi:hypothetical protein